MAERAAQQLKLTAPDLIELNVIDGIIPEPLGGAHRNAQATFENVANALEVRLDALCSMSKEELLDHRYRKFRAMGRFIDNSPESGA
jgi:acetyl-CoA carboxylase carboxyl transferase subunit alpha